jgi:hypothetical protein
MFASYGRADALGRATRCVKCNGANILKKKPLGKKKIS